MTTKDRLKEFLSVQKVGRNKFEEQIGVSIGYLSTKSATITSDVIEKTIKSYPNLSIEWLITGQGGMLKSNTITTQGQTRPRIPLAAAAGSLTEASEGVTIADCEQMPIVQLIPSYDFTITLKGDSLYPKYESGDEVACKRIDQTSFIQWGKLHVLDTSQGIVAKRIYDDGDKIRCVSYNPEYPDFSIDKREIYSISLVVGLIRI